MPGFKQCCLSNSLSVLLKRWVFKVAIVRSCAPKYEPLDSLKIEIEIRTINKC